MQQRRAGLGVGQKRQADQPGDSAALRAEPLPKGGRVDKAAAAAVPGVLASHVQSTKNFVGTGGAPRGASRAAACGLAAELAATPCCGWCWRRRGGWRWPAGG